MTNKDKLLKIIAVMESGGWDVASCDFCGKSAFFKKGYATVVVSFDECSCHGGRITVFETNHDGMYYRIEHECYDPTKGITDSETELLWEIDNELLKVVEQFGHYTYKSCVINKYGKKDGHDAEDVRYHRNLDEAFRAITDYGFDADPLTFTEGIHDYPNPKCHLKVTRIRKDEHCSWERNRLWFELEHTDDDWKTSHKYEAYLSIFDKMA